MDVTLSPSLSRFVEEKVRAGQYSDANAVIAEALELLRERKSVSTEHEEYLQREVQRGLMQADRGEYASFDAGKIIGEERGRSGAA